MDKQQLNKLIESGGPRSVEELEQLDGCLREYPHFVAAEVLRLAHLQAAEPQQLPDALKRVAFLLPNRKHLHAQLFGHLGNPQHIASEPEPQSLELLPDDIVIPSTQGSLSASSDDILELIAEQPPCASGGSLIDQFLHNLPHIQRPAPPSPLDEQPENIDISAQSVIESDEVISEQLAEIHIVQGNTARALEIYRRLMLKYPEKSAYFAAQIAHISQSLNN
ncbi:MAG: hypothetical protein IJU72_01445 [Bacteroidales bacterium]|nr:hypothetical protein [Bacteroidales bacterium]